MTEEEKDHKELLVKITESLEISKVKKLEKVWRELTGDPVVNIVEDYLFEKYKTRYNEISAKFEYEKGEVWEELNPNELFRELQKQKIKFGLNNLKSLLKSDFIMKFNPFNHYFENLPTQTKGEPSEIEKFCQYIHTTEPEVFAKHFKKHLVRAVACALNPNYFNKQCLVFVGGQNNGKSSLIRFLVPPSLKEYYAENIGTDKDSMIAICENFIVNLDELSTLQKSEVNALKSVFSKQSVKERRPYDDRATHMTRVASFFGSTNNETFLNDETGSVRWLCFEIVRINFDYSKEINIDKVWAEAYQLYKEGNFEYNITLEEIAQNEYRNEKYLIVTVEQEAISQLYKPISYIEFDKNNLRHFAKTTTELMTEIQEATKQTRITMDRVTKALKILGFTKKKMRIGSNLPLDMWLLEMNEIGELQDTRLEMESKESTNVVTEHELLKRNYEEPAF
jgi:predicted P-loop ATPase